MSIQALSDTTVRYILQNLKDRVKKEIDLGFIDTKSGKLKVLNDVESEFGNAIRTGTSGAQEGLMTERSLDILQSQFQRAFDNQNKRVLVLTSAKQYMPAVGKRYPLVHAYIQEKGDKALPDLSKQAATVLSKPGLYKDFVQYFKDTYIKNTPGTKEVFSDGTVGMRYPNFGLIIQDPDPIKNAIIITGVGAGAISHAEFNRIFYRFLATTTSNRTVLEFIEANTDAGHILGVFNIKFATLFDLDVRQLSTTDVTNISVSLPHKSDDPKIAAELNTLNKTFKDAMLLMAQADVISSNLFANTSLAATTIKHVLDGIGERSSVELQLSVLNRLAGSQLSQLGVKLKKLGLTAYNASMETPPGATEQVPRVGAFQTELAGIFNDLSKLGTYITEVVRDLYSNRKFLNKVEREAIRTLRKNSKIIGAQLAKSSGSISILQAIKVRLVNELKTGGKTRLTPQKSVAKSELMVGDKTKKSVKIPKPIKSSTKAKLFKPASVKVEGFRPQPKGPSSPYNLLALLNASLHDQIRKNMGTGNSKTVLNYRTGRFAESVKVERISESRQGMITAFYSYMKNPYATFSQGGRQQYPRSRDPKTLISKSIREIAQTMVTNQLRAVNV